MQEGSLRENGLCDGSKIILIPNVETGLLVSFELVETKREINCFVEEAKRLFSMKDECGCGEEAAEAEVMYVLRGFHGTIER